MKNPAKEHYQRLRFLSCGQLWEEVAAFDRAGARERMTGVGVIRAVGVVFAESGSASEKEQARQWLRQLLNDPEEKVRRYAMAALPKIGADAGEETALLALLKKTRSEREKRSLGRALEKIGGRATLEAAGAFGSETVRKVEANLARSRNPGAIGMERIYPDAAALQITLHCRSGLEEILEDELRDRIGSGAPFRPIHRRPGAITIAATGPFKLADLYALRCFGSIGIILGTVKLGRDKNETDALAAVIAAPRSRHILEVFTEGPIRYRLDFVSKGHQRAAVREVAGRVYERCPSLLNDSRDAPWQINMTHGAEECVVELCPRLRPDPRFAYRQDDVPAASHPPLAACMARLAGQADDETMWDPFCGSGLELIERALRGGVRHCFGTDRSAEAVAIARGNLAAALAEPPPATFTCCDFREYPAIKELENLSLIITNPPMGRRVPVANLSGLIAGLFVTAAAVLRPGGRLVFPNPLPVQPKGESLKREYRRKIDLGGFHVHLEKYVKLPEKK